MSSQQAAGKQESLDRIAVEFSTFFAESDDYDASEVGEFQAIVSSWSKQVDADTKHSFARKLRERLKQQAK